MVTDELNARAQAAIQGLQCVRYREGLCSLFPAF